MNVSDKFGNGLHEDANSFNPGVEQPWGGRDYTIIITFALKQVPAIQELQYTYTACSLKSSTDASKQGEEVRVARTCKKARKQIYEHSIEQNLKKNRFDIEEYLLMDDT